MALLEILTYPDERLRRFCDPVEHFDDPALQTFLDDLIETMQSGPGGVGIAAPQVNRPIQVLVMDCGLCRKPVPGHHGRLVVCNPEILSWNGLDVGREGCLSLPDYTANVARAINVKVRFQDRQGNGHLLEMSGFEARVLQHEMDHLDGKLFLDRIVSRKSDLFRRKNYQPSRKV
jgi:peptide deformylase